MIGNLSLLLTCTDIVWTGINVVVVVLVVVVVMVMVAVAAAVVEVLILVAAAAAVVVVVVTFNSCIEEGSTEQPQLVVLITDRSPFAKFVLHCSALT